MKPPGQSEEPRAAGADVRGAEGVAIHFDQFTLFPAARRLQKSGEPVPLGTRAFDLLVALAEGAPRVVSKEELFERVWPGRAVEEINLRFQINALRKALGDDPAGGRYITTVQGRGYCFVATVGRVARATPDETRNTNLPLPTHAIVDRESELAELEDNLQTHRLVTVLGSGGVGKTRLAIELGLRVLPRYPDGVWLIDLAPLSDPSLIAGAAAAVLGLSAELPAEALARRIANRTMLLIFDNCEHLVDAAAELAKVLVAKAGGLSVLATSQESLGVAEEQVYRLEPLALAPVGAVEIAGYGAVALFVELARRADRGFALTLRNAEGVADVCRRLDGVPLALEMAAARVPMLGLEGLRSGLAERLRLLKRDPRRSDGRHPSLRHLADWSYGLLDEIDQRVFCRLAIFPGSFALDAVVAIMAPLGLDRWGSMDALWRLREKSLIAAELGVAPRYRLLETLRLYASEHLRSSGDTDAVADLHARHFAEVFQHAEAALEAMPDSDWTALYRPEIDNLRAALDWALAEPERRQTALSLATPCLHVLRQLSLIAEGQRYSHRLISLIGGDTPPAVEAGLLRQAASFWRNSPSQQMADHVARAVALYRDLDDRPGLARALNTLGVFHLRFARYELAEAALTESLSLSTGRDWLGATINLGVLTGKSGRSAESRDHFTRGLVMSRDLDSPEHETGCLMNLSALEYMSGNFEVGIERCREAIACARASRGGRELASLDNLAIYLLAQDRAAEARPIAEEVFARREEYDKLCADLLQTCAFLAGREGRLTVAARILGFVDVELTRVGVIRDSLARQLHDDLTRRLEAGLPAAELLALKAEAAGWSEAEAVRFAAARLFSPEAQRAGV